MATCTVAGRVLVGECAAAKNRDAVSLEVVGRDHVKARAGALGWIGKIGLAGDREGHAEAGPSSGKPTETAASSTPGTALMLAIICW